VVRCPISACRGIGIFTDPSQNVSCLAPSTRFHSTPCRSHASSSAGLSLYFKYALEYTSSQLPVATRVKWRAETTD